jgi:hypothetical protein
MPGMHNGSLLRSSLLCFCLLFLLAPAALLAQRPVSVKLPKATNELALNVKMACNDAGDVNEFSGFMMRSNSFGDNILPTEVRPFAARPDTIFLCAGDGFNVDIVPNSFDLSGDPDGNTTPGIGYAFYRCAPTVSGPLLTQIAADACVANNGLDPFDSLAVAIPRNYATGDYTLTVENSGDDVTEPTIMSLFPNMSGNPSPVVLTLAPITFDDANLTNDEPIYEGNPAGQCVHVSTDQAFSVAYLNAVTVDVNDGFGFAGCDGFFAVRGGTPELRGGTGYTIRIENTMTGELATIQTAPEDIVHNALVRYQVPTAGTYRITIEDENSCGLNEGAMSNGILVGHPAGCQQPLSFNFPFENALPGESFCVPVTVDNFDNIQGFQFDLQFDPAVLRFDSTTMENAQLGGALLVNGPVSSGGTLGEGRVRFVFNPIGFSADIPDGDPVFNLCFTVIGNIGDQTPLEVDGNVAFEFTRDGITPETPISSPGSIVVSSQPFLLDVTPMDENCLGAADGSITASAIGGPDPYIFEIRLLGQVPETIFGNAITRVGNPAEATFNGLPVGIYALRSTSANGDQVIDTVTVNSGLDLSIDLQIVQRPSCAGFSDGVLTVQVFVDGSEVTGAGLDDYEFIWSDTDTVSGPNRSNLPANLPGQSYTVQVVGPNGLCTSPSDSETLRDPMAVQTLPNVPSDAVVDATCTGADDGSITVNAAGGTGPYSFDWGMSLGQDDMVANSARTNLVPGAYAVTVTDTRGCADTANFVVNAIKTLEVISELDSITCFGENDAVIRATGSATGAAPDLPFEVSLINLNTGAIIPFQTISDPSIPFEFPNLDPATYVVVLRDQDPAGCEATDTIQVIEPALLEINDIAVTNETCAVGMDGSATPDVTGGTGPYEYRWVNDSLDTPIDTITPGGLLTGLSADTNYVLIVTDSRGCTVRDSFQVLSPGGATFPPIDTSFVSCPGDVDGQLTVVATPPQGETITAIVWYRLNPDGTLGNPVANGASTQNNLPVGDYAVEITTSNACVVFGAGSVVSPGDVFLESFAVNDPQCPGDANGSIFLTPNGGTPNGDGTYNYVWSTDPFGAPTTNPAFTNLQAGSYTVTITDGNGCQPPFDTTFVLTDPPSITGVFTIDDVSCPDDTTDDGAATFEAEFSDGTAGTFDFLWDDGFPTFGAAQSTVMGRNRGPVSVRVTDGICTETFRDTIRSPEEFAVNIQTTPVSCNGLTDGTATVEVTGGTANYTFSWSVSGDTDNSVSGLGAGMGFTVDIIDANGCSPQQETFQIMEPDPLTLSIDPVQTTPTVRCAGDANGQISVFISSVNNNPLSTNPYTWSGNVAGSDEALADDLQPGTYGVTVTDIEGCQDSLSYTIGEPEAITFSVLPIEEPLCFGELTPVLIDTAFGGTSNSIDDFTFSVNNDGFRIPVGQVGSAFAGEVLVTVFDSVGCPASQTFSVNQPPQILVDLPEEIVIELGDSLTQLNPIISPAGDVYTYQWTPGEFLNSDTVRNPTIFPFESEEYTLTVTNANGCQAFADIFVEVDANRNVYIPNAFSPNRDGRNEDFRIFACQGVRVVNSVKVFDRWGGLVYENENLPPNCLDGIQLWDGTRNDGKAVSPAVFVYMIEVEFLDNTTLLYRGDIAVVR